MKKLKIIALSMLATSFMLSCSGDDTPANNEQENQQPVNQVTITATWKPTTIQIVNIVVLQSIPYPHAQGCNSDHLNIYSDNTNKMFNYTAETCEENVQENAFQRNGNEVTINIQGFEISGTVQETNTQMKVSSDISEYQEFVEAFYPDYADMLNTLSGSKVVLTLEKQ